MYVIFCFELEADSVVFLHMRGACAKGCPYEFLVIFFSFSDLEAAEIFFGSPLIGFPCIVRSLLDSEVFVYKVKKYSHLAFLLIRYVYPGTT